MIKSQGDNIFNREQVSVMESQIKDHYNSDHLTKKIKEALIKADIQLSCVQLKDLSPIDQLHTGGAPASIALLKKANLPREALILDAGCGLGGSSRLLAKNFNAKVIGVDLADRFIKAADFLTQCTGLEDKVSFKEASVLDLPFEDNTFDVILCQHILMNIQDKKMAVKEFFRVLKKDGQLILHEITKGTNENLLFPVPWAGNEAISFLEPWDSLHSLIEKQGFETVFHYDETKEAFFWWKKVQAFSQKSRPSPNPLNPGLVFGKNAKFFAKNMETNFKNNSICLIEAVLKKSYYK